MRYGLVLLVLLLSACGGYHSNPGAGEQYSSLPPMASGGNYMRDGFYDGGAMDPDQTPRAMELPE